MRKVKDGVWEIGVHIADVTHYVKPHSVIDDEAVERAPRSISSTEPSRCSPNASPTSSARCAPNETSLCFSRPVFTLNENLEILDEWFGRTVIHSDRRFTYAEAQEVIETRTRRLRRGDPHPQPGWPRPCVPSDSGTAPSPSNAKEVKFRLDDDGKPLGVYFKEQKESNQMIEEFMLLANRRVAEFCAHRRNEKGRAIPRTMVFRVHDAPSEEKLDRFRQFILRFGHVFKASKGRAVAREMNRLFKQIKARPRRTPSRRWPCAPWPKPSTRPTTSATTDSHSNTTPTSPRPSAATPT